MPQLREYSQISDDDPVYDSVASDDDYAVVPSAGKVSESVQCSDDGISDRLEQLTKQLQESDTTITDLKAEVSKLRAYAESLKNENIELKTRLSQVKCDNQVVTDYNSNSQCLNGDGGSVSLDGFFMVTLNLNTDFCIKLFLCRTAVMRSKCRSLTVAISTQN